MSARPTDDRDIVDEIDQLVDTQLQQERSGYDHNINQTRCPHTWCDADWHGLPIKRRMQQMRDWNGSVYPEYSYADDDSPVICPGSLFDGEFEPPEPESNGWQRRGPMVFYREHFEIPDGEPVAWTEVTESQFVRILTWSNPFLPDVTDQVEEIIAPLRELGQATAIDPARMSIRLHTDEVDAAADETTGDGYERTSTTYATGGPIQGPAPIVASDSIPFVLNPGEVQVFTAGSWQPLGVMRDVEFAPDRTDIEPWGSQEPIRTDVNRETTFTIHWGPDNPEQAA